MAASLPPGNPVDPQTHLQRGEPGREWLLRLGWAVGLGATFALANALTTFDANVLTDPRPWVAGLLTQVAREIGVRVMSLFSENR